MSIVIKSNDIVCLQSSHFHDIRFIWIGRARNGHAADFRGNRSIVFDCVISRRCPQTFGSVANNRNFDRTALIVRQINAHGHAAVVDGRLFADSSIVCVYDYRLSCNDVANNNRIIASRFVRYSDICRSRTRIRRRSFSGIRCACPLPDHAPAFQSDLYSSSRSRKNNGNRNFVVIYCTRSPEFDSVLVKDDIYISRLERIGSHIDRHDILQARIIRDFNAARSYVRNFFGSERNRNFLAFDAAAYPNKPQSSTARIQRKIDQRRRSVIHLYNRRPAFRSVNTHGFAGVQSAHTHRVIFTCRIIHEDLSRIDRFDGFRAVINPGKRTGNSVALELNINTSSRDLQAVRNRYRGYCSCRCNASEFLVIQIVHQHFVAFVQPPNFYVVNQRPCIRHVVYGNILEQRSRKHFGRINDGSRRAAYLIADNDDFQRSSRRDQLDIRDNRSFAICCFFSELPPTFRNPDRISFFKVDDRYGVVFRTQLIIDRNILYLNGIYRFAQVRYGRALAFRTASYQSHEHAAACRSKFDIHFGYAVFFLGFTQKPSVFRGVYAYRISVA